ncbi:unnamed protein product [Rhizophagus irregularis]|nr:unnamed protein product [Rhizophagus irregularis]
MSYKCPFCPRYFSTRSAYTRHKNFCTSPNNDSSDSEELEEFEHKTNNHDIEMVCEDSCKDLSENKSTDSEINNQSFQSMMSISEVGEIDQNIEEIDHDENENVFENILEDSDLELNEEESKPEINVNYPSEAYVTRDNLADFNLQIDDITPRTILICSSILIKTREIPFALKIYLIFFGICSTVPDRMHHLDLGLFHYQIDYTKKLLGAQCGKTLVDEVDHRLAAIPRFPSLKIFTNGIQSIARLTANEYRNLMKVMVFVVDNLFVNNEDDENFVKNKDLAKLYEAWNEMYAISRYENFKESDLVKFRESIKNWSQMFIKILQCISPSELKLLKLHSWAYHIIDSIRSFATIPHIFKFTAILFEFLLKDAHDFFVEQANIDDKMRSGFDNFLECLNLYMDHESIANESQVTIYRSVIIENGAIMRATNSYYGRPWYSNVSVRMNSDELFDYASDQGICYRQVLLIVKIELKNQNIPLNLALIQWYNFKFQNQPHLYGCPLLEITEIYNFINIEAIQDIVHIVPRFDKTNEYFVNKYIF